MTPTRPTLIGALLPKARATSAATALEHAGLAGRELSGSVADDDSVAVEPRADRRLGIGLLKGAAIGGALTAVAMVLLAVLALPSESLGLGITVGATAGLIAGGFIGAYLGMTRHRPDFWRQQDWEHIEPEPNQVLMVVDATDRAAEAEQILVSHGGRLVEPVHPDETS